MIYGGHGFSLDDVTGGTLNVGILPATRAVRFGRRWQSAAPLTIPAAEGQMAALSAQTVQAGDYVLTIVQGRYTKGVSAGSVELRLVEVGGAVKIKWDFADSSLRYFHPLVGANQVVTFYLVGFGLVYESADVMVEIRGQSVGATAVLATGDLSVYMLTLYGDPTV